ncbi:MAG: helix-turn-helix domain-containing protein [Gammaproteobacteria bacterium]|nr:helix-turn-helix domain-containing protein [Gammaproteobacteria bacterium]
MSRNMFFNGIIVMLFKSVNKMTAALFRVDAIGLRRIARKGGISYIRMGRRYFFKRHDLCLWLQQRYQKSEQE